MARETGVILKTRGSRGIVLTPQGEFRTVPRIPRTACVGQEIEFTWPVQRSNWRLLLAAASLFLVLAAGTLLASVFPAAGYVSVDINPSIELGLNAWGRVVRVVGLDSDGKNLLRSLPLYGRPLDQALDSIANRAVAMHFLRPGDAENLMVVTYTPGRLIRLNQQEQAYRSLAAQLEADRTPARLVFADVTRRERAEARKVGLSTGKYLVWERLLKNGGKVTARQMAQTSIGRLLLAEKMRLGAILGPDTTYREVKLPVPPAGTGLSPGRIPAKPVTTFHRQHRNPRVGPVRTPGARSFTARSGRNQHIGKVPASVDGGQGSWQAKGNPGQAKGMPGQGPGLKEAPPGPGVGTGGQTMRRATGALDRRSR